MSSAAQLPRRCWAEIDLAALERNLKRIRGALPAEVKLISVVKADAYGHGVHQVATHLMHAGADLFGVATLSEAIAIRELSPDWPVLLLSPLLPDEDRYLATHDLAATISSEEEAARFDAVGRAANKPVAVHLKIDTGMGRLGVWHEQVPALYATIRRAKGLRLAGLFTHFASAGEDPDFTEVQRKRFVDALTLLPGLDADNLLIHADNSAGIESMPLDGVFNAARVGLLQFGVLPQPHSPLARFNPEPVFSFHTRVGLVKQLPAGTGISYGLTHQLARPTTIAVLAAGYGDGIPRAASNRAFVLIQGRRCPVLGRITMDQTIVDVTDLPKPVRCGDAVVLVGRQEAAEISVAEFSSWAGTIAWEVLCSVSKRVPRIYRTARGI